MNENNIEAIVRRSNSFKLLSVCYYEPEIELFLQENLCENLLDLLGDVVGDAPGITGRMKKALDEAEKDKFAYEHAVLFVGPFELKAPPYGSVYLDGEYRLMGDTTMDVTNEYHKAGIHLDERDAPDHIAFELEYIHYLSGLEAVALKEGDEGKRQELVEKQRYFLEKYLTPWVSLFCDKIRKGTDNEFYKGVADLLDPFIDHVTQELSDAN